MKLRELNALVSHWADERNIIDGSTITTQSLKLTEEAGELVNGIWHSDKGMIKDGIGDCVVVLNILLNQLGTPPDYVLKPLEDGPDASLVIDELIQLLLIELSGIASTVLRDNNAGTRNHIEAAFNVLVAIAINCGLPIEDCYAVAWNEIKDRKGKMVNGCFVKEEDLDG